MINKSRIIVLSIAFVVGFAWSSYADQFQGKVESISIANNTLVIKDPVTGDEKSVTVHPKVASVVQKGSIVKATFQPGSAIADTLEVLEAR